MWAAAAAAGIGLSYPQAVAVTAVTIAAQTVAVTPGGIGGYEAAATAALVGLGAGPGPALAAALVAHATKTAYALVVGGIALVTPAPAYFGRLRLARALPPRPRRCGPPADAPVVRGAPGAQRGGHRRRRGRPAARASRGRPVRTVVVDDGSTDGTAARGRRRPAPRWSPTPRTAASGAAVRRAWPRRAPLDPAVRGLLRRRRRVRPRGAGRGWSPRSWPARADYVVGLAGSPARSAGCGRTGALGNRALTRWAALGDPAPDHRRAERLPGALPRRRPRREIVHDYNYAQVLTLDLLAQGLPLRRGADHATRSAPAVRRSSASARYLRKVAAGRAPRAQRALDPRRSVLDHVGGEAGAGRGPAGRVAGAVRASASTASRPRHRVVGVVVREQAQPAERRDPVQPVDPLVQRAQAARRSRSRTPGRRAASRRTSTPAEVAPAGRPLAPRPVPDQRGQLVRSVDVHTGSPTAQGISAHSTVRSAGSSALTR